MIRGKIYITWHIFDVVTCLSIVEPAGDLSRNNWLVGILAWGEGWHNNHHAFEYSAQHGMGRNQFDMTWQIVRLLSFLGLAKNVRLPSDKAKTELAI